MVSCPNILALAYHNAPPEMTIFIIEPSNRRFKVYLDPALYPSLVLLKVAF